MSRLPQFAGSFFAVVHVLLFSICCPVSSRIYRSNDAVVIEVDDVRPSTFANRNSGIPPPFPMMYAINPETGLSYQQQPNFPFWPYPLYQQPAGSVSNVDDVKANSPQSRQQNIACGVGPDSLPKRRNPTVGIAGGTEAKPNSWPFMVGLRIDGINTIFCGGSIISKTTILTAAHCVNDLSASKISSMTVSLGMHTQGDGNTFQNDAQQTRRVTRVVYHINYNKRTKQNDVALLTVDPAINYSAAISPVCLPAADSSAVDQFVDKDAAIMGWGKVSATGSLSNELKQATVRITSKEKCNKIWASSASPFFIFNQHICASANGKDTCQGDSGGPMVVQTNASSTAWTQVGVTSFGGCFGNSTIPSVYANVAFFRKWIDTFMD
ncbi:hypothetical protein DAPPUDRAFT_225028 [Daphnia pulex]|uniref:Peptidase S1 domain-containing protein n=1 Tax=Daphnia pulex TaxID=6669 RepID=E9GLN4_DAPPU|nr:hypothetical protein DAPPUDRAFT_225028 [Daphnia pulex]|eukprot:EFX79656.1 hypothetical protein DAPPUDRAFT_225028 [Daphnia pulex]